jgi:hypothetical protein
MSSKKKKTKKTKSRRNETDVEKRKESGMSELVRLGADASFSSSGPQSFLITRESCARLSSALSSRDSDLAQSNEEALGSSPESNASFCDMSERIVACYHARRQVVEEFPSACLTFAARLRSLVFDLRPRSFPMRLDFAGALDPAAVFQTDGDKPLGTVETEVETAMTLLLRDSRGMHAPDVAKLWSYVYQASERVAEWLTCTGDVKRAIPYWRHQVSSTIIACQQSKWRMPSRHEFVDAKRHESFRSNRKNNSVPSSDSSVPASVDNTYLDTQLAPTDVASVHECVTLMHRLSLSCQNLGSALLDNGDPTEATEWMERGLGILVVTFGAAGFPVVEALDRLIRHYKEIDTLEAKRYHETSEAWCAFITLKHREVLRVAHGSYGVLRLDIARLFAAAVRNRTATTTDSRPTQVYTTKVYATKHGCSTSSSRSTRYFGDRGDYVPNPRGHFVGATGLNGKLTDSDTQRIIFKPFCLLLGIYTGSSLMTRNKIDEVRRINVDGKDEMDMDRKTKAIEEEEEEEDQYLNGYNREECRLALLHLFQTWRDFKFSSRDQMIWGAEKLLLETEARYPFDSPPMCAAHTVMSDVYLLWLMYAEALSHLRSAYASAMRNSPRNRAHYEIVVRFVGCLLQLDKCDEASTVIKRSITWLNTLSGTAVSVPESLPLPECIFVSPTPRNTFVSPPPENTFVLPPPENTFVLPPPENTFVLPPPENTFVLSPPESLSKLPSSRVSLEHESELLALELFYVEAELGRIRESGRSASPAHFVTATCKLKRASARDSRLDVHIITCALATLRIGIEKARTYAAADVHTPRGCWHCGQCYPSSGVPLYDYTSSTSSSSNSNTDPSNQKCCAKCKRTWYCRRECQLADWTEYHKTECVAFRALPPLQSPLLSPPTPLSSSIK